MPWIVGPEVTGGESQVFQDNEYDALQSQYPAEYQRLLDMQAGHREQGITSFTPEQTAATEQTQAQQQQTQDYYQGAWNELSRPQQQATQRPSTTPGEVNPAYTLMGQDQGVVDNFYSYYGDQGPQQWAQQHYTNVLGGGEPQSLSGQSQAVQDLFGGTYGDNAAAQWAQENVQNLGATISQIMQRFEHFNRPATPTPSNPAPSTTSYLPPQMMPRQTSGTPMAQQQAQTSGTPVDAAQPDGNFWERFYDYSPEFAYQRWNNQNPASGPYANYAASGQAQQQLYGQYTGQMQDLMPGVDSPESAGDVSFWDWLQNQTPNWADLHPGGDLRRPGYRVTQPSKYYF